MAERWDKLEAEMRRVPLEGLSPESEQRILDEIDRGGGQGARLTLRRVIWSAVAAAACVAIGAAIWFAMQGRTPPPPGPSAPRVALTPGWRVEPIGDAEYCVLADDCVRLDRGELLVESIPPAEGDSARADLRIETPGATATASGTKFYIGAHALEPQQKGKPMRTLTRVFVLAGVVALGNHLGTVTGGVNDLLAAEGDTAPIAHAVKANSDFAFDLYKQVAAENTGDNLFFSPYSISSALAMTAEGARGATALEMGKVLRFPQAARRVGNDAQLIPWRTSLIHAGMGKLNARLTGKDKDTAALAAARAKIAELRKAHAAAQAKVKELRAQRRWREISKASQAERQAAKAFNEASAQVDQYELRIANALWGEKTYPFGKEYVDTVAKHYETGGVFPADFKTNFPAERTRVNRWVEDQTNNRIKDLIPELPPNEARMLRLILTNAIYFKGDWSVPFKEASTKDLPFTLAGGKTVKTPIMNARNLEVGRYAAFNADGSYFNTPRKINIGQKSGRYPPKGGFAMLELPYKGDEISMVLVAPTGKAGLAGIEKALTPTNVAGWIGKGVKRKTHVFLPKFKLETSYKLGDTLKAMGMVRAFTDPRMADGADFSGMSASGDPRDRLYISKVIHKAFVEVNEKGTEAAAATAVMMGAATGIPRTVPFTPTFKADRPFLFIIRDRNSGSILFMGRMMDPTAK